MNCHDIRTRLAQLDAAGDALPEEVQSHIERCPDCRRLQERLTVLRDPASALSRELHPSRDLWPGIASRLDAAGGRTSRRLSRLLPLAAAAALAGLLLIKFGSVPFQAQSNRPAPASHGGELVRLPVRQVEAGFIQTRAVLVEMVDARKPSMSPERRVAIEHALASLDVAAQDLHTALERDPYNASLLFKLSRTRRLELRYLRRALS